MDNIKVAIADDANLFANGLKLILELDEKIEVELIASNGQELIQYLNVDSVSIDIIILDLEMPIKDGVDTLREIISRNLPVKVIILTSHFNDSMILKLLDEGAVGFLAKNEKPEIVIEAIKMIHQRGVYFGSYILQLLRNRRLLTSRNKMELSLTKREIEILKLVCEEYTNLEIAEKLFISKRTVDGHRQNILTKTGCKNTVGLVIYAIKHNIIEFNFSKYQ